MNSSCHLLSQILEDFVTPAILEKEEGQLYQNPIELLKKWLTTK